MHDIEGVDAPGEARTIALYPNIAAPDATGIARLLPTSDRAFDRGTVGGGQWSTAQAIIRGPNGAYAASLSLTPAALRRLADFASRMAAFIETRSRGAAGPCICTAWGHGLTPCPNDAALDYSMCRDCWTPAKGQQGLDMAHGSPTGGKDA